MFQTILDPYDVFRNDINIEDEENYSGEDMIETDPRCYLSRDGFYL
ncbi:hypothetical protein [Ruminococcus sp.]|nr:hypothetical protein [Ruminococcus sp.]